MKYTQDIQLWGQSQVFVILQKNCEGITLKPEIRHGEWNNKRVGFGAEISSAANEEDCKSISNDGQKWKKPAKNPKPGLHLSG